MAVNQRKAGATLTYIQMGICFVVSLIFTPVLLRLLGQSEYGLYDLVASVVSYLGVLNFGFGSAYMRYFSRYKVDEEKDKLATLNGMFLIVFSVLALVAVVAGFILAQYTDVVFGNKLNPAELAKAEFLMYILVLNLGFSFPSIVFTSYITANERFVFQKLVQLIKTLTSPFLVLPVLLLGYGSIGYALATSVVNLLVELVYAAYSIRKLKMRFSFKNMEASLMKEMSVFSFYIFINMLVDQINWSVDKFLIGRFQGTVGVAVYGVASTINNHYRQISQAVSNVFIPRIHRMVANRDDNDELTLLFTKIGRVQFVILALISSTFIFFGKPFIMKWAGQNYADSYYVVLFLILPVTIPLIQTIGIEIQRAKNMHQFRSIMYFLMAVANLFVSIPLTRTYGPVGAAAGTAISMILGNGIAMNLYNHYKIGLDMVYFWKQILRFVPALIAPVVSGVLIMLLVDLHRLSLLLAFGALYLAIYLSSMWFLGLNSYEKDQISKPIKRILKRS
ncbi:MAG: oligosaccharide flippase family protein [Clostridiaceae bacterium]|nr:oligosaccharide flippase family protein [Clostridiaceae bacterium]